MTKSMTTYQKLRSIKQEIDTIEELHHYLRVAMEIELSTIPAYLCALYSIKPGTNQAAIDVIKSVVIEEMLHLTLAGNVLSATGGLSMVNDPEFIPVYPTQLPDSDIHGEDGEPFIVPLQKFSPAAIDTFLRIEQPEKTGSKPRAEGWNSIGQFYAGLKKGLVELCEKIGVDAVFTGHVESQILPEDYYGAAGEVIVVANDDPQVALENAMLAFDEIVEQGEGMDDSIFDGDTVPGKDGTETPVPAHYFRFQEIKLGRYYVVGDCPGTPTGSPLIVDWDAVYPMCENPMMENYPEDSEIRGQLIKFNSTYMRLLDILQDAFLGDRSKLMAAVGIMYEMRYQSEALMKIPTGVQENTVGPSFQYILMDTR